MATPAEITPQPVQVQEEEGPARVEDQILIYLKIASELVALVYLIDLATGGSFSESIRWRFRQWKARLEAERQIRADANRAVFEALTIIEGAA